MNITRAMKNLTQQSEKEIQRLGATLLTSYAYDNLDVNLPHSTSTIETSTKDTLVHLTTASMFPLHPSTTRADLGFTDRLREIAINPPIPSTMADIISHLPPTYNALDDQKRSIQHQFNAWKLRSDLVSYGPAAFTKFKQRLREPEEIECIPLVQTKQVPLRASTTAPSTPAQVATVLEEFFQQSNVERTYLTHPEATGLTPETLLPWLLVTY
jgi:hypothetical protein